MGNGTGHSFLTGANANMKRTAPMTENLVILAIEARGKLTGFAGEKSVSDLLNIQ